MYLQIEQSGKNVFFVVNYQKSNKNYYYLKIKKVIVTKWHFNLFSCPSKLNIILLKKAQHLKFLFVE